MNDAPTLHLDDPTLKPLEIGRFVVISASQLTLDVLKRELRTTLKAGGTARLTGPLTPPVTLSAGPHCTVTRGPDGIHITMSGFMLRTFESWTTEPLALLSSPSTDAAPRGLGFKPSHLPFAPGIGMIITPTSAYPQTVGFAGELGGKEITMETDHRNRDVLQQLTLANTGYLQRLEDGDPLRAPQGSPFEFTVVPADRVLEGSLTPLLEVLHRERTDSRAHSVPARVLSGSAAHAAVNEANGVPSWVYGAGLALVGILCTNWLPL